MTLLHTSFVSGTIFSTGSNYGDVGASGLNTITNEVNIAGLQLAAGSKSLYENSVAISGL